MLDPRDMLGSAYQDLIDRNAFAPFSPAEVEVIEDESYVEILPAGMSLVMSDGINVSAVHLHASGHEGYVQFAGDMPIDLRFDLGREAVRKMLGSPESFSDGVTVPILGRKSGWDVFHNKGFRIHVEYSLKMDSIQLISITQS